jgi:predicted TIM-barrel fold metal-dependent hydrolase
MAQRPAFPIIDTHIHLFDPTRPQGVPWPPKDNAIMYRPALPARYRALTGSLGVVGAIEIECSPWLEDNQWVLDIATKDTIVVGTVGDLEPEQPDFRPQLERFHANPLFRGIRCGNLWGRDLRAGLATPEFVAGLKLLAEAGLELDTANPNLRLLEDVVRLTDRVPGLRVVIDHLPKMDAPADAEGRAAYHAAMRELSQRPQVYVKVSAVLRRSGGTLITDPAFYRPKLDELWYAFGPDRLLYGSDWPNSDPVGTYAQVLSLVRAYFQGKGREAEEKFFWKNSLGAYRWVKRAADQPTALLRRPVGAVTQVG